MEEVIDASIDEENNLDGTQFDLNKDNGKIKRTRIYINKNYKNPFLDLKLYYIFLSRFFFQGCVLVFCGIARYHCFAFRVSEDQTLSNFTRTELYATYFRQIYVKSKPTITARGPSQVGVYLGIGMCSSALSCSSCVNCGE